MRLIMRIRVSSATTTSPKNNRTANTDTHTCTHTRTVYVRGTVISIILMCIWFCPFSRQGARQCGRGLLFNCLGKMPGLAMYFFVQLQLIELAATQWNPIEQKYFWSLFKMLKTI